MNSSEILGFIAPQFEPLQLSFFVLIVAMFIGTIVSTHWNAKNSSWERIWNNGTPNDHSDDLDIDHGSVTDLWHAVATKSEKLAEIMPGMLLVVGLLGTFLGLGLALNHASNILGQSGALSATGTANSMQDLMSMMQGLGTKFKTSTWGIAFFLLLKVWSSWVGFDEKRLTWVIRKVKAELEHRKRQEKEIGLNKQQALFTQINEASTQIVTCFAQNFEKLSANQKAVNLQTLQYIKKWIQDIHGDLASINTTMQKDSAAMREAFDHGLQGIRKDLKSIATATQASSQAMDGFVSSTQTIINDMSAASKNMADGANKVGIAGSSLVNAVDAFSAQFTQVLGQVRIDLSTAINEMSEQAAHTLEQGTKELGKATLEISTALGVLSTDVTTTMNGVKDSIEKSLKIQQDGAVLFRRSSDTLNENVTATTELVQKLGEDIRGGLQAVSDSGRRMTSIGKSLEAVIPQMGDLIPALEPLKTLHAVFQPLLDEIQKLRSDFGQLNSSRESQLENSLKIQEDLSERHQQSTVTLNENVTKATALVQKLGEEIVNGLQVITTASGRMPAIESHHER